MMNNSSDFGRAGQCFKHFRSLLTSHPCALRIGPDDCQLMNAECSRARPVGAVQGFLSAY